MSIACVQAVLFEASRLGSIHVISCHRHDVCYLCGNCDVWGNTSRVVTCVILFEAWCVLTVGSLLCSMHHFVSISVLLCLMRDVYCPCLSCFEALRLVSVPLLLMYTAFVEAVTFKASRQMYVHASFVLGHGVYCLSAGCYDWDVTFGVFTSAIVCTTCGQDVMFEASHLRLHHCCCVWDTVYWPYAYCYIQGITFSTWPSVTLLILRCVTVESQCGTGSLSNRIGLWITGGCFPARATSNPQRASSTSSQGSNYLIMIYPGAYYCHLGWHPKEIQLECPGSMLLSSYIYQETVI